MTAEKDNWIYGHADAGGESKTAVEKVAEMQRQIDEGFRLKQYIIQRLAGYDPTTFVFDDPASNHVIELLNKKLKSNG